MRATGLDAGSYDLVVCSLVDEHLADLGPLYAEAGRLLAPGGRFVLVGVHPFFVMAVGMPTHFDTPGGPVAIETHVHLPGAHVAAGAAAGLVAVELHEGLVGDRLIELEAQLGALSALALQRRLGLVGALSGREPGRAGPAWNPGTHPPYHWGGHGPCCSPPRRGRARRPLPRPRRGRSHPRPAGGRRRHGPQRRRQDQPASCVCWAFARHLGRGDGPRGRPHRGPHRGAPLRRPLGTCRASLRRPQRGGKRPVRRPRPRPRRLECRRRARAGGPDGAAAHHAGRPALGRATAPGRPGRAGGAPARALAARRAARRSRRRLPCPARAAHRRGRRRRRDGAALLARAAALRAAGRPRRVDGRRPGDGRRAGWPPRHAHGRAVGRAPARRSNPTGATHVA